MPQNLHKKIRLVNRTLWQALKFILLMCLTLLIISGIVIGSYVGIKMVHSLGGVVYLIGTE
jgi:hypothetical protein